MINDPQHSFMNDSQHSFMNDSQHSVMNDSQPRARIRSTTILAVRRNGEIAVAGDGQVTLGDQVMKQRAVKIRKLYKDQILSGFAGGVADALTLYERMEKKLETCEGDLLRASVELTKDWRSDKYLRRLEAMLLLASKDYILTLAGTGEVIESEADAAAIGSGGGFAKSAALALLAHSTLSAKEIAQSALKIAGEICIYTNTQIACEGLTFS